MDKLVARFRAGYGAGPRHLLLMVACFTVTGWVAVRLAGEPAAGRMLIWFVGAAFAHDLVLFPVYALADRGLRRAVGAPAPLAGLLNHLRAPALASGLLLLVFLPSILGWGGHTYLAATGQEQRPYLGRWLLLSAALFLLSAAWYAACRLRSGRRLR